MPKPKHIVPDPECQRLAEHLLCDEPWNEATRDRHEQRVLSLTRSIQDVVSDWFEDHPLVQQPRR